MSTLPTHPTLRHPRTGEPLRAIGYGRRGPIWPVLGGDGTDPTPPADPPTPPAPPTPPVPTPPPAPPVPTPPPAPPAPPAPVDEPPAGDESKLPAWARAELARTRAEAAARRVSERAAHVSRDAFAAAGDNGVNPAALLGSTDWVARAGQLDPNAADYRDQLAAAIKATAEAHPWVKAVPAGPGRSGGELPNNPPPPGRSTTLDAAVRAKLGG
ncbi:hypothetical protein GCM10018962_77190 [Dactylosporangium matsuzakiense]|uniref:hypothetical protein n=1 Tax=Dactylosporangium matsuzakiense TaxID=53360 RepID=UPI0031F1A976